MAERPSAAVRLKASAPGLKSATRLLVVVTALGVPLMWANRASSDTTNIPPGLLTTVSTPTQSAVSPNGPLTGLSDGTTLSITITGTGASAGKFFGADARLCKTGLNISFSAQFSPTTGGVCVNAPLSATSDDFQTASAAPTNTTVTFDFRVGTGSQTYTFTGGSTTITCDASNPCALWLNEAYDVDTFGGSGSAFVHYDLLFGTSTGTTTTSTSVSTSTTSTTLESGTTTTTSATTSTTSTVSTTISTSSTSTTSTTLGSATTTTSTTIDPSVTTTTTTNDPATTSSTAGGVIGVTGIESEHLVVSGLGFVGAGGLLLVGMRRHRRNR